MNGPVRMYSTRELVQYDLPVTLPECMYKMKNIHVRNGTVIRDTGHVSTQIKNLDTFDQVIQFLKNNETLPEMTALIARQEDILQQLEDLKKQMFSIKNALSVNTSIQVASSTPEHTHIKENGAVEAVINVSPLYPPYFLEVIQKRWAECVHLKIKSHVHSSVGSIPETVGEFMKKLENFKPSRNFVQEINLRLIWKDVGPQTELIISKTPILGEVNILRYLARIMSGLNYEKSKPFEIDSVLDSCYLLVRAKTKTERTSLLQALNKKLGKSEWFCGLNEMSIADIAAYSAMKQIPSNEINVNMMKWLQKW